jgi:branched-chain amino acid transport system permease protein
MISFDLFWQAVVYGLIIGSIYALTSSGLTLILGVLKIINVAHGEFLMTAMYTAYFLFQGFHLDPCLSIFLVMPALFFFGGIIFYLFIRPVLKSPEINQILLTIGISIFLQNLALALFTGDFRTLDLSYSQKTLSMAGVNVGFPHFMAFIVSVSVTLGFYWFLKSTDLGRSIRAAAQNQEAAILFGINVDRIYLITFSIGAACLGVAGPLLATFYYVTPTVGTVFLLNAFVVVILGGMGNFLGAFFGGLLIGLTESIGAIFMPGSLSPVFTFVVLIIILLLKPEGLFGRRVK